jgi:hypothetical protein
MAFYISKEEFEDWWQEIEIIWHNQNSWCGFGKITGEILRAK